VAARPAGRVEFPGNNVNDDPVLYILPHIKDGKCIYMYIYTYIYTPTRVGVCVIRGARGGGGVVGWGGGGGGGGG